VANLVLTSAGRGDCTVVRPVAEARRTVDISVASIARVLAAIVLVWLWLRLWRFLMVAVVAIVVAVALEPVVAWLERRRISRGAAATAVVATLTLLIVGFFWITGSSLTDQARDLSGQFEAVRQEIAGRLPPFIREAVGGTRAGDVVSTGAVAGYAVNAGRVAAAALLACVLALILTLYLLIEGRRTYAWLLAYVPPRYRDRAHVTAMEARHKILHYAVGNVATSVFAGVVAFAALSLLHVPAALLLAILAGIFDFVPVLGFICSAAPAILLATSRGTGVALEVAAIYAGYHFIENYYVGPRVYGGQLRLSNLAVIVAFAVGAEIGGVVGALLALPIAALYPVIERVWLREYLGRDAVETHRRLEDTRPSQFRR
jgi:predicted PurR-regulated permease PerM